MEKIGSWLLSIALIFISLQAASAFELDPFIFRIEREDNTSDTVSMYTPGGYWPVKPLTATYTAERTTARRVPVNRTGVKLAAQDSPGFRGTLNSSGYFDHTTRARFNADFQVFHGVVTTGIQVTRTPLYSAFYQQAEMEGKRVNTTQALNWYYNGEEHYVSISAGLGIKKGGFVFIESLMAGMSSNSPGPLARIGFALKIDDFITPSVFLQYSEGNLVSEFGFLLEKSWIKASLATRVTTDFSTVNMDFSGSFSITAGNFFTLQVVKMDSGTFDARIERYLDSSVLSDIYLHRMNTRRQYDSTAALQFQVSRSLFHLTGNITAMFKEYLFRTDFISPPHVEVPDISGTLDFSWDTSVCTIVAGASGYMENDLTWSIGGTLAARHIEAGLVQLAAGFSLFATESASSMVSLVLLELTAPVTRQGWFFADLQGGVSILLTEVTPVPSIVCTIEAGYRCLF
jgi:hypothetical protein